jgi:exopolysaccharide biosynthesis predicted pyruvyltransferase EpsI
VDCSPYEVISYFKNAKGIITDTFHGSILSIITQNQFVTLVRKQGYGNVEKLMDLLKRLKLEYRVLDDMNELDNYFSKKIDYSETNAIITKERENTYNYLREQLEYLK